MSHCGVIVLKFGGSVLGDESCHQDAVHEIYRWRRTGWRVVAVVSALEGRTDELFKHTLRVHPRAGARARAAVLSSGERENAALLGLYLDRAGVTASVLTPASIGLIAEGDALDAAPTGVSTARLINALDESGVVVIPGFAAVDQLGRPVVMGRGGSDLTALTLAHELGAMRCRLIKDVDGLYESNPALPGPRPRRYAAATYADALATDGSIVQHKAVRYAKAHGVKFELGTHQSENCTRIGTLDTTFDECDEAPRRLRTALLGHGAVGGGVAARLLALPDRFELVTTAVRDLSKHSALADRGVALTTDPVAAVQGAALVIETLGGIEPAKQAIEAALQQGACVVSANKALLAAHGTELYTLAHQHGGTLLAGAAVGGATPVLERLAELDARRVVHIEGLLNSTSNFVLNRVSAGIEFDDAVREAQGLGYAEADPSLDLTGRDALDKLRVIALALGGGAVVERNRDALTPESVRTQVGPARHTARLARTDEGWAASVTLEPAAGPLAEVEGADCRVIVTLTGGEQVIIDGIGAGRWPTAESVMGDALQISRAYSHAPCCKEAVQC